MQKLLTIFVLLIVTISYSCGTIPVKPEVESCILIAKENTAFCVNNMTMQEREIPIIISGEVNPELDKHNTHSNKHWGLILTYIRLLENAVPKKKKYLIQKHNLYEVIEKLKKK